MLPRLLLISLLLLTASTTIVPLISAQSNLPPNIPTDVEIPGCSRTSDTGEWVCCWNACEGIARQFDDSAFEKDPKRFCTELLPEWIGCLAVKCPDLVDRKDTGYLDDETWKQACIQAGYSGNNGENGGDGGENGDGEGPPPTGGSQNPGPVINTGNAAETGHAPGHAAALVAAAMVAVAGIFVA